MTNSKRYGPAGRSWANGYKAGGQDRLFQTFGSSNIAHNSLIGGQGPVIMARARNLFRNSPIARAAVEMLVEGVLGSGPLKPQSLATRRDGAPDQDARFRSEQAFEQFCRAENCHLGQTLSLFEIIFQALQEAVVVGEAFLVIVPNRGPFGVQFQPLPAERLDHALTRRDKTTHIRNGIEIDREGRRIAYHFLDQHPHDPDNRASPVRKHTRVMAERVIHIYRPPEPEALRGVSWLAPAVVLIWQGEGYLEAETVAARINASKGGYFITPNGDPLPDAELDEAIDALRMDIEPGLFQVLPEGMSFQAHDNGNPTSTAPDFIKVLDRKIAACLGVPYSQLSRDYESTSFSASRMEMQASFAHYRRLFHWFEGHLQRIFETFLTNAVRVGEVRLPGNEIRRFLPHKWPQPIAPSVDPTKEARADIDLIEAGLKSRRQYWTDKGLDPDQAEQEIEGERAAREPVEPSPAERAIGATFQRPAEILTVRAADQDDREIEVAFSSDAEVARPFGMEILDHSPQAVDLAFLTSGRAPLLREHDPPGPNWPRGGRPGGQ